MLADRKILTWMMKGSVEYNDVQRSIDMKLLREALLPDYKPLAKLICSYFSKYKTPPSYKILSDNLAVDIETAELIEVIKHEDCDKRESGFYLDQIRDRYNAFLAKRLADSISEDLDEVDIADFNQDIIAVVSKIERLRKSTVFSEGDFVQSATARYNDYIYLEENPNKIDGVFSGYKDLDDYIWGIKNQELMIISGASSSGKSLLMMNMAINAWLGQNLVSQECDNHDDGKNILYFTLEMSKKQLEQRIDACITRIRHKALTRGFLSLEEKMKWKKSLEFQKNYEKRFYVVDMPRGSRTLDIEARFDSIIAEFTPDLVCVDYLGIMKPNTSFGQDWLEVGHVAEDLHEFCRNKNIPVITAAQRKTRDKRSKTQYNDLEELGRSKMIGDNANIVLLIEQREDEHLKDDMILHISKNRDGEKGKTTLIKEFEQSRVAPVPDGWAEDEGDENDV